MLSSLHVLWNTRLSAQPSDRPKKKAQSQRERDEIFIDFMMCMQEAIFSAQDWTWVYPMEVCVCLSVYEFAVSVSVICSVNDA